MRALITGGAVEVLLARSFHGAAPLYCLAHMAPSHATCVPQALLDDQIVKAQSMRASPFIKPLEARAVAWESLLVNLQVGAGPLGSCEAVLESVCGTKISTMAWSTCRSVCVV